MTAYYNENNKYAAEWLRNLIDAGCIAPGVVDDRSIEDVLPSDLRGFTQCHFFAGVGVWSYALRQAGWADERPVWTGSCPCQPFSAAGKGTGFADERHLWPAFHHLIKECKAPTVFGEQVASKDAGPWIDLVQTDLETLGYAFGAVPFPAAGVGAPHIRDRLYWVADTAIERFQGRERSGKRVNAQRKATERDSQVGGVANANSDRCEPGVGIQPVCQEHDAEYGDGSIWLANTESYGHERAWELNQQAGRDGVAYSGAVSGLANPNNDRCAAGIAGSARKTQTVSLVDWAGEPSTGQLGGAGVSVCSRPGPTNGFWRDADWLLCRDEKWRPVRPGSFPLVNGAPSRVGRLRAYGNAINAKAAQVFIESVMA